VPWLGRGGFDNDDINAELFAQSRELFSMFDQLMQSAQNRRIGLLREISLRREFTTRVRRVLGQWIVGDPIKLLFGRQVHGPNSLDSCRTWRDGCLA
jgi:hypothetical protein